MAVSGGGGGWDGVLVRGVLSGGVVGNGLTPGGGHASSGGKGSWAGAPPAADATFWVQAEPFQYRCT